MALKILSSNEILKNLRQMTSRKTREEYSLSCDLSDLLKLKDLHFHYEILSPGKRSSAPHHHSHTEESFYVLKGAGQLRLNSKIISEIKVGDCFSFSPEKDFQELWNHTQEDLHYLSIRYNHPEDQVTYLTSP